MKCIAVIAVDLAQAPLGTRSRLSEPLKGTPVLRRTLNRVARVQGLESVHLLAPADQVDSLKALVDGLAVRIEPHRANPAPYDALVQAGRWWGLDSWRGGVGGLTVYDEDLDVELLAALAAQEGADAVMSIPAAAVLADPGLLDAMIRHYEENRESARMTFVQAPPGLGAMIIAADLLGELAPTGQPAGVLLGYHPDRPLADLTGKEACYRPSAAIIEARGRLLADTHGGIRRLAALLEAGAETWDAEAISRWLMKDAFEAGETPSEIEIELTTDDPLPNCLIRPRGASVGSRGPIRQGVIQSILESLQGRDDVRVVLGGFGEPCLHPAFGEICTLLRRHPSVGAIAVRTSGLFSPDHERLAEAAERAIFETPLDVVEITIDAFSSDVYHRVHGFDGYESVLARLERWIARRQQRQQVRPLLVPSFTKSRMNVGDMEEFYDHWQRRLGAALITGYSHCAGQRPEQAVTSMAPPVRSACRRVFGRAVVLADGRVTTCDQDFAGRQVIGAVGAEPLEQIWRCELLASIRRGESAHHPLCAHCDEWHRP